MKMKKLILTFSVFALTLFAMAQTEPRHFHVIDPDGWVNMRAGAGTNYEVIRTIDFWRIVLRDFDRQIINNWIPVKYAETPFSLFEKGYIHGSRLRAVDIGIQEILPKASTVDMARRAQLSRMIAEIDTMELRQVVLRYKPGDPFRRYDVWHQNPPHLREVLYFDENEWLRKYSWEFNMSDGAGEHRKIIAYYDKQGDLIGIFYYSGGNCEGASEMYLLHRSLLVDFRIVHYCYCCEGEDISDFARYSEEQVNEIRPAIGSALRATTVVTGGLPLTSFLNEDTLLRNIYEKRQPILPEWLWREWESMMKIRLYNLVDF